MTPRSLEHALDSAPAGGGTVEVPRDGGTAEIDLLDVDRLGVRVRGVRVRRDADVDVATEAARLPDQLRSLPDRVTPVEVAPSLGGARLRTRPEELRGGEYFEVDVEPRRTSIRRTRVTEDGTREPTDWTLTRDQLERLIDEAAGPR
ncbi:MAG: hypothetical protein ABMA64_23845 [Myxococcota bacterium]